MALLTQTMLGLLGLRGLRFARSLAELASLAWTQLDLPWCLFARLSLLNLAALSNAKNSGKNLLFARFMENHLKVVILKFG